MKTLLPASIAISFLFLAPLGSAEPDAKLQVIAPCEHGELPVCICDLPVDLCSGTCPLDDPHLIANYGDDVHQCLLAISPIPPPI